MRFSDITGQEEVSHALAAMCDSGRVAHAVMLHEDEGSGGLALALAYVQYLNCQNRQNGDSCGVCASCRKMGHIVHPDVHFVYPVNSGSKIDASKKPTSYSYLEYWRKLVLENPYFTENELNTALGIEGKQSTIAVVEAKFIVDTLSLSPVEDGYRAVIIWLPEKMRTETANKLLKTLEEPPEKTVFVLVTQHPEDVITTVASRCLHIRVAPVRRRRTDADYVEFMALFQELMTGLVSRDLSAALDVSEKISLLGSRDKQKAFCIFAEECIGNLFLFRAGTPQLARVDTSEAEFYSSVAAKCGMKFFETATKELDRSVMLVEGNVNAKIVFCDLVDRMFLSI